MGNSPLYPGIPSGAAGGVLAGSFPNPSGLQPVGGKISLGSNAGGNIKLATDDAPPSPGFPSAFFAYAGSGGDADATYSAQFGPSFHIRGGDGGDGSQEYPNAGAGGHVYVNGGFSGSAYPGGNNAHAGNVFIGTDSSRTSGTEIGNADAETLLRGSVITIAGRSAEAAEILQSRPEDATRTDLRIRPADGPTSTEAYGVYGGYFFLEGGTGGAGDDVYPGQRGGNVVAYGGSGGADGGAGQGSGGSFIADGGTGLYNGNVYLGATRAEVVTVGRLNKDARFPGWIVNSRPTKQMHVADLGRPLAASSSAIKNSITLTNTTINSFDGQPDTPRNITASISDGTPSIVAGTIEFQGTDMNGFGFGETWDLSQSLSFVGTKIFAAVEHIAISGVTLLGGEETLIVGFGNLIGLPCEIYKTEYGQLGAVKHIYLGGARVASPTITMGTRASGVDASSAVYDGSKQLRVYYNPGIKESNGE